MNLDEAIEHAEEVAESLEDEGTLEMNLKFGNTREQCLECAKEHRQLAAWLKELKRLQSISTHGDVYDEGEFMFSYFECQGESHISVYQDGHEPVRFLQSDALSEPFSHEQFVEWCKEYMRRKT